MNDDIRRLCDQFDEMWKQLAAEWKVDTLPRRGTDGLTHAMALTRLGRELVDALRNEDDENTITESDFSQFDNVDEFEDFADCDVASNKGGMLSLRFDGDDTMLFKVPVSVVNSTFRNPSTGEQVEAADAKPGMVCDMLWLKKGVAELLGLI